jgi:hypothetical protein
MPSWWDALGRRGAMRHEWATPTARDVMTLCKPLVVVIIADLGRCQSSKGFVVRHSKQSCLKIWCCPYWWRILELGQVWLAWQQPPRGLWETFGCWSAGLWNCLVIQMFPHNFWFRAYSSCLTIFSDRQGRCQRSLRSFVVVRHSKESHLKLCGLPYWWRIL